MDQGYEERSWPGAPDVNNSEAYRNQDLGVRIVYLVGIEYSEIVGVTFETARVKKKFQWTPYSVTCS